MKKETNISSSFRLRPFSARGFTLIELLIVIAITAVLTGLAAPRYFNAIARYRVEMAAHRVAADLSLASSTARQTGKPVVVTFNQAGSTYTMAGVSDLRQRTSSNYFVDLSAEPYRSTLSLVQPSSGAQITFDIYGMPSCAGQILLQSGAYTKTALLDQTSGEDDSMKRMRYRHHARGFTLVEAVMSMVVLTIIVGGLSSGMVLMLRTASLSAGGASASTTTSGAARSVMDQITDDLKVALTIPEQSATAVTMTVPDRNGDGQPETIRYAWSGTSGDPITRQYNGGAAVSILNHVTQFNLKHLLRSVGPTPPPPPVESAEQLLCSSDQILLLSTFGLKSSTKAEQYFMPSLPSNAISWKVTRVKVEITRNLLATADAQFEIDLPNSQNQPSGSALYSTTVPITGLGLNQTAWVEFDPPSLSGLDPYTGLCIVAESGSSSVNYYVNYFSLSLAGTGAFATSSGSWGTPSTLKAMQFYVYGTITTQP